jgi:urea carboxylase
VSAEELLRLRQDFPAGRYTPKIEHSTFKLGNYLDFLDAESISIEAFRYAQRNAFAAERERWRSAGLDVSESAASVASSDSEASIPEGHEAVISPVSGSLWKFLVKAGDRVEEGQAVVIVEAMKMEIQVASTCAGTVAAWGLKEGQPVMPGQMLLTVQT